jgi:TatD DNase family protein
MFDIHTHKNSGENCIHNLNFAEAETQFAAAASDGYFSVGIHPCDAGTFTPEIFSKLQHWASDSRIVMIGECGLDKNADASIEQQLYVLEQHISLSESTRRPLIIHCVGYFNELLFIKKTRKPSQIWIIHGFRGKPQMASQLLQAGFSLSYGEYFNPDSVRITPFPKLFAETDESNLSISDIYNRLAKVKGCFITDLSAGDAFIQSFLA